MEVIGRITNIRDNPLDSYLIRGGSPDFVFIDKERGIERCHRSVGSHSGIYPDFVFDSPCVALGDPKNLHMGSRILG